MTLLDNFILRALLAGLGAVLAAAPLGCFVIWRRMAYFGDATAHAAILGVALAFALQAPVFLSVLGVALAMALTVAFLSGRGYAADALLGVMAHSALAFGLVAVSLIPNARIDLNAFLFGDILAVSRFDVLVIWGGAALILLMLWWRWSSLLIATLSPDLAHAAGVAPRREQMVLTLAMALVVAVAIKVIGVLLIGAMLITPAAAARPLAASPERMAVLATLIGALSVVAGLWLAFLIDTPAAPTIVAVAAMCFLASNLWSGVRRRARRA